jgi:membrane protease YdiL (CAAX protease family)
MSVVAAQRRILAGALARLAAQPLWLFWAQLAAIGCAELLIALVSPHLGQLLHLGVLLTLLAQAVYGESEPRRGLALALTLAPLTRLLSLTLPLSRLPPLLWYPLVGGPLLVAAWMVVRTLGLSGGELGLRLGRLPSQLLVAAGGLGIGAAEYAILRPPQLFAPTSPEGLVLVGAVLTIAVGLVEELVFRGLLQGLAWRVMGWAGALYVALLFAALHIGYRSFVDLCFVFIIGILFAYIVRRSGSILGVTLAHGLANLSLYVVFPLLAERSAPFPAAAAQLLACLGILLAAGGALVIAREPPAETPGEPGAL